MSIGNVSPTTGAGSPLTALQSALRKASSSAAGQTPTQEALETKAQTQAEATKGDPQAKLKLAREQAAQASQQPPTTDTDGDHDGSGLDVKA